MPTQVDLPPGNGRGIHCFHVDRKTGAWTLVGVTQMGFSPSCLAVNAAGNRLYAANETQQSGDAKEGVINGFIINRATGELGQISAAPSGGAGPTYISLHPSGRWLLVANYFGGSVAVLPIDPDGKLGPPTDVQNPQGPLGPTKATNAPPGSFAISGHDRTHAHMIAASPDGRFIYHADLALDRIFIWTLDEQTGKLSPAATPSVSLPPGDGPRHFILHPNGRWFYSIQEEGSTVTLFDCDSNSGALNSRQTISTLPKGFAGSNFTSEILISKDGRYLYAGNRLHDSIAIFGIGNDGTLSYRGEEWTHGDYPRSFTFEPSGRFLYCCNQRGDNVTCFAVNPNTGKLTFTGQYVPVGNPSHVAFVEGMR